METIHKFVVNQHKCQLASCEGCRHGERAKCRAAKKIAMLDAFDKTRLILLLSRQIPAVRLKMLNQSLSANTVLDKE